MVYDGSAGGNVQNSGLRVESRVSDRLSDSIHGRGGNFLSLDWGAQN